MKGEVIVTSVQKALQEQGKPLSREVRGQVPVLALEQPQGLVPGIYPCGAAFIQLPQELSLCHHLSSLLLRTGFFFFSQSTFCSKCQEMKENICSA